MRKDLKFLWNIIFPCMILIFRIGFKHAEIFPEGGILCRLLFDAEPIFGIIGKEDGSGGTAGRSGRRNILCLRMTVEFFDEFLFHGIEIFGSDFDVVALFAVTGLEQTVVVTVFDDAVIVNERLLKGFGHMLFVVFSKSSFAFLIFRNCTYCMTERSFLAEKI